MSTEQATATAGQCVSPALNGVQVKLLGQPTGYLVIDGQSRALDYYDWTHNFTVQKFAELACVSPVGKPLSPFVLIKEEASQTIYLLDQSSGKKRAISAAVWQKYHFNPSAVQVLNHVVINAIPTGTPVPMLSTTTAE